MQDVSIQVLDVDKALTKLASCAPSIATQRLWSVFEAIVSQMSKTSPLPSARLHSLHPLLQRFSPL